MSRPRKKEGTAQVREVQTAAVTWSDAVLRCRLRGHSWDQERAELVYWRKSQYWHIKFYCERGCGVTKWEEWDSRGIVTAKAMTYPRGEDGKPLYLLEGVGRLDAEGRGVLRIESVTRTAYVEVKGGKDSDTENAPHSGLTVRVLGENR